MESIVVNPRMLVPRTLAEMLPPDLIAELELAVPKGHFPEELRLRRDRQASVTVAGQNIRLGRVFAAREMEQLLLQMCRGSLYAHAETLSEGYLVLPLGVRVGVSGHAAVVGGRITGVESITAFSVRLPRATPPVGEEICALLRASSYTRGVLLFAPPGVGKTTLLRGVARLLAGKDYSLRVVVVDTRGELAPFLEGEELLLDVLSGYPRGKGIGIATRTMAAQVIVCDEIGDLAEAQEILAAHTGGVPLVATAHATGVRELLARPALRLLHEAHCFGAYVGVRRDTGEFRYTLDVADWDRANAYL